MYPEEVEAVVKNHPSVYDAVVVGAPHERWGEQVVAVVAPRPGATVTLDETPGALPRLARRIQAAARAVRRRAVVRGPNGKADYRWARERALASGE